MAVEGIVRRRPMCKVCEVLSDARLTELTLDILQQRRSYREIMVEYQRDFDEYNKTAVHKVANINATNLSNHKHHSDPALIADKILKDKGIAINDGDTTMQFLQERYASRINLRQVMDRAYRSRLGRMAYLERFSAERLKKIDVLEAKVKGGTATVEELAKYEDMVTKFEHEQSRLIRMERDFQDTLLHHRKVNETKGANDPKRITYYFIDRFYTKTEDLLADFGNKLLDYVVGEVFRSDKAEGIKVVKHIAELMDASLMRPLSADLKAVAVARIPSTAEDAKFEEVNDPTLLQIEAPVPAP